MNQETYRNYSSGISRILVCEDDQSFRKRLSRMLRDRGFMIFEAENIEEGYQVVMEFAVDACIIDLRMPGGDGLELVSKLSRSHPEVRTVLFTGFGTIQNAIEAIRLGAFNYITKPASIDEIIQALYKNETSASNEKVMPPLEEVEMEYIKRVLNECEGNISVAAKVLGLHRRSLQRKLTR
jgi:two-component system, response regulator RegA